MLATILTKTFLDRWKGMAIGAVVLGAMLLFGMATYRDIDLSLYTDLPEALRAIMNIPAEADVGSLAYGAIYSSYGALTLAGLALSMGSASIAGEERDGTLGLLLGNPKSRTAVLASKAATMVLLTAVGALVLWGAGLLVPAVLGVDITGTHVGALVFHMFAVAVFFGALSMAVGAWTGKSGMASGISVAVLVLSFFAVGLLPLFSGLENGAKAFPWYYYDASQPVLNGVDWGHVGVLLVGIGALLALAVVGVNRRDLRERTLGVTMVDRLRAAPLTKKLVDRLAGSARVSRIAMKTASEYQGLLIVTAYVMFLMMGVLIGIMYQFLDDTLATFAENFPEALLALVGGGDMSTPEGWFQVETYGLMAPIGVMVVTIAIGAKALAGEEARRTMGLLLANPLPRSKVVLEKTVTMVVYAVVVGVATFAGVALGSLLGGLGLDIGNVAATSLLVTLLGLVFGAFALVLSAATGRVRVALFGAIGAAIALHLFNAFLPLNDSVAGLARLSPFYYYLSSDPLMNGMAWGHTTVLAGLFVALLVAAVMFFDRRDLRQN